MRSKKFIAFGLILMGVGTTSFTPLYAKQSIQPNVVYSLQSPDAENISDPYLVGSKDSGLSFVDDETQTYYRTQTADALKKYFNISLKNPNEQDVMLVSAKIDFIDAHFDHDYVVVDNMGTQYTHISYFNANTKEIMMLNVSDTLDPDINLNDIDKQEIPSDAEVAQFEKLGADFIKQYQLGGLENPKFIKATGFASFSTEGLLLYEDANDASKKAVILVNCDKEKVTGFYIKDFADEMQKNMSK